MSLREESDIYTVYIWEVAIGGVGMLQLHKITASALTAFFLISGIFAPYGSLYPFFSSGKSYKKSPDLSKEINDKKENSPQHNNNICFEDDFDQKKIVDFGTSLLLCQTMYFITNLHSIQKNGQKFIETQNLSLDMITYIHKIDGEKGY